MPAATTAPATGSVSFDDASLKALQNLAAASAATANKPDPIVLGHSKVADGGTLRRSEFFSAGDVAVFEAHEAQLTALSEVPKGEDLAFTAALHELPEQARDLLAVPVNTADMAKNQRLLVLQVVQLRQTTVADNIILQGTALSNERETEEERKEDAERAAALRYQKQGDFVKGGPQLCVVSHRLDSLWTFLQIPYLANAIAAELNGSWDTTWFTWAKAGHAQLGPECEVIPGAQQIVSMVRVRSNRAHAPWPNQTKADYPAVALWLFTRDYRAYREGVPGAKKPSLLGILTSSDFVAYLGSSLDYGYKPYMRPNRPPYIYMRLGTSTPIKRRPAISVTDMNDDDDDDDDRGGGRGGGGKGGGGGADGGLRTPKKPKKRNKREEVPVDDRPHWRRRRRRWRRRRR